MLVCLCSSVCMFLFVCDWDVYRFFVMNVDIVGVVINCCVSLYFLMRIFRLFVCLRKVGLISGVFSGFVFCSFIDFWFFGFNMYM